MKLKVKTKKNPKKSNYLKFKKMKLKLKTKKNPEEILEKNNLLENKNFLNSQNYILGKNETKKLLNKFFIENILNSFGETYYILSLLLSIFFLGFMYLKKIDLHIFFINIKWYHMNIIALMFLYPLIFRRSYSCIFRNFYSCIYGKRTIGLKEYFKEEDDSITNGFFIILLIYFLLFLIGKNIGGHSIDDSQGYGFFFALFFFIFFLFYIDDIKIFKKIMKINLIKILYFPFIFILLYFQYLYSFHKGKKYKYKILKFSPQTKFLEKFEEITPYLAYNKYYKIIKKLF